MVRSRPCAVSNHERERVLILRDAAKTPLLEDEEQRRQVSHMSKPPPAPPSLEVLRKEIDAIDEQVHRLLMARGDIIDRLIR